MIVKSILTILLSYFYLCISEFNFEENGKKVFHSVSEKIFYKDFLDSYNFHNKYRNEPYLPNSTVLGYVTPWNSRGYDIALEFSTKFTHISPVWLRFSASSGYKIYGQQDIDIKWINKLTIVNPSIKILPRIIYEHWSEELYQQTFRNLNATQESLDVLIQILNDYKLDGAVIEIWSQYMGRSVDELVTYLRKLGDFFRQHGKLVILVIPPPVYNQGYLGNFNAATFDRLYNYFDYFSLMTYDYSNAYIPGPNSPIGWVRNCINLLIPPTSHGTETDLKRSKLLVGLNFYGNDYAPQLKTANVVLGRDFVYMVEKYHPKFHWLADSGEHVVKYTDSRGIEHSVFYPSLLSLAQRISLTQELNTGISIWELGQGLDSFYELF